MIDKNSEKSCQMCSQKSACFGLLSNIDLERINKSRQMILFRKGEVILKQGSYSSNILYLQNGLFKLFLEGKSRDLALDVIPSGHFAGLPALYGNHIHPYSVQAYVDSYACLIEINMFRQFIANNPKFAAEVLERMSNFSRRIYNRFFSLNQKNVPGRFADLLLHLTDSVFQSNSVELPLSRKDLAELSSMTVESISRVIRDFNSDGIIRLKGRSLQIIDKDSLRKISQMG